MSDVKKTLKGMEVKEMVKCDGCGQYHPVDDCEVVIIKMIKGKACSINPVQHIAPRPEYYPGAGGSGPHSPKIENMEVQDSNDKSMVMPPQAPASLNGAQRPVKKIIPSSVMKMMYPPGDPRGDTNPIM